MGDVSCALDAEPDERQIRVKEPFTFSPAATMIQIPCLFSRLH